MTDERAAVELNENAKLLYWCEGCGESFYVDDPVFDHAAHDRSCDGRCLSCPVQCGPIHIDYDFAHRAVRLLSEREDALRAENERLKAENASLKEANEIDLGEKAPLIFENTALSARVSELTRLLGEAESAIRFSFMKLTTHRMIRVIPDETWPDGWDEWHKSPAVQRALQSGEGGK